MGTLSYGRSPPIYRHFDAGYFEKDDKYDEKSVNMMNMSDR